jgi:hypothetical protein
MNKLYTKLLTCICFFSFFIFSQNSYAQCNSGSAGITAYDTTIRFPTGATNMQVKFPKFNPQTGMVTCVRLVITIIGVVDSVAMQNYSGSGQTADFYYDRADFMSGPGLTPSVSNSFNGHYGPQNLMPYDGLPNSGPDFYSIARDTVLRKVMTRTLTDSLEISQFYGSDSVTYNYNINVTTSATITGGSSGSLVLTSALVNFRFEYCTCPITALPVGIKNFSVNKATNAADLRWEAEMGTDNYYYEIEVSRDGRSFSKAAIVNKLVNATNPAYHFNYGRKSADFGRYYFRVKQRWLDGYYRYSEIKSVEFSNPLFSTVSIYPNPSHGNTGIKFIAAKAGNYSVEVSNATGQVIFRKELQVAETDYKQLPPLQKGMYYVKITELSTRTNCIQQLIVQ